jgi:murein DD-endopeptidase MepM/ murein hydrolase activator NlpD
MGRLANQILKMPRPPMSLRVSFAMSVAALLSFGSPPARPGSHERTRTASLAPMSSDEAPCPAGTLPDGDACVHVPDDEGEGAPEVESSINTHRDPLGHWTVYDEIPRRPERPADYDAYRYPVPCERGCVASGYDLDRVDSAQRRGRHLRQVGHGAVDLVQPRGTPILNVALEHQEGDAEVIYVGPLFGTTVVTRHTLREAGKLHDYLLLFGHLESAEPDLRRGAQLREGDRIGFVGDTGSPDLVHLHLEARRVRDGVDASKLAPSALVDGASSVVCDPRNVMPLR